MSLFFRSKGIRFMLVAAIAMSPMLAGCGGQGAVKSDTPEAVFATAKQAMADEDFETFASCLTEESQDQIAAAMVMVGPAMKMALGMATAFGGAQNEEQKAELAKLESTVDKMNDILEKHGVDPDNIDMSSMMGPNMNDEEAISKIVAPIKDKPAFIGEMLTQFKALADEQKGEEMPTDKMLKGELKDLTIDGDSATATIAYSDGSADDPIQFKKTDAGWRIDLPQNNGMQMQ